MCSQTKNLKNLIYLIQTDTTVGLVSQNSNKLTILKKRPKDKKFIKTYCCFKELKKETRIPKKFRRTIRNSKKTTFVYPDNIARRVVFDGSYKEFLNKFLWVYSTSANISTKDIDLAWAINNADVVVTTPEGFEKRTVSMIFKIGKNRLVRLRV